MNADHLRNLIDECFAAKKITESMIALPRGMKGRHIHIIEVVHRLRLRQEEVRVSDVSRELKVTMPSVTKLINELEKMDLIRKYSLKEDKRVTLLQLTHLGEEHYKKYVEEYHTKWAAGMPDVTEEEIRTVSRVIYKMKTAMPNSLQK